MWFNYVPKYMKIISQRVENAKKKNTERCFSIDSKVVVLAFEGMLVVVLFDIHVHLDIFGVQLFHVFA